MSNIFEERGYRITSGYGNRDNPINQGNNERHRGIDMVKPEGKGAPIYAFVGGRVVWTGEAKVGGTGYGGYGIVVAIEDKLGYTHCYCHLSACLVNKGSIVDGGQMIGRMGDTGRSLVTGKRTVTGVHLHYEVRREGFETDVDPLSYLESYFEAEEKLNKPKSISGFPDVPANTAYDKAIALLKSEKIIAGKTDGTFGFGEYIKREDMALMIARILERG